MALLAYMKKGCLKRGILFAVIFHLTHCSVPKNQMVKQYLFGYTPTLLLLYEFCIWQLVLAVLNSKGQFSN